MTKKVIIAICSLVVIGALILIAASVIGNKVDYDDYTNEGGTVTSIPMEDNPNVKKDADDFIVTDSIDISTYAKSVYDSNIVDIYEVLVTDNAIYYVVSYEDGYSINVTFSNGEYSFEETPTNLDLEQSD